MRNLATTGAAACAVIALAACQGKPSAVAPGGVSGASNATYFASTGGQAQAPARDPRDLPVPRVDGKPMWAANRKHTAEENAEYQFGRNGGDFGVHSESEYVTKAHAFVDKPPRGVETVDRANGDRLMYDARNNTFVVVARSGAPRTMFKPRGGAAYWAQQKDREAAQGKSGGNGGSEQS